MNVEKIEKRARKAMAGRKECEGRETGYIYSHGRRVGLLAVALAEQVDEPLETTTDELYVGGLLHDLGKGDGAHHHAGADRVPNLLDGLASDEEIDKIAEIVRYHNDRSADGHPVSVRLVQDADVIDHHGAMGIWIGLHWATVKDESPSDHVAWWDANDSDEEVRARVKWLRFKASREVFEDRIAFELEFRRRLAEEDAGRL